MDERLAVNRARWDESADLHVRTYGIDRVDAGGSHVLHGFEPAELGRLDGKRVCHLQCHIGGDSFALAQLGARRVVGVDLSPRSIEIARMRAERIGMADRVSFVCAPVDDALDATGGAFDVVYTSWGVLCWLPDLDRWAQVVASLLVPGGFLYLAENHPYATASRWPGYAYSGGGAHFDDDPLGDYSDPTATFEHSATWEWAHGLGEIVTALIDAGLHLDWLHEHPVTGWNLADPDLVQRPDGMWEAPGSDLPLSYSLRASVPTAP